MVHSYINRNNGNWSVILCIKLTIKTAIKPAHCNLKQDKILRRMKQTKGELAPEILDYNRKILREGDGQKQNRTVDAGVSPLDIIQSIIINKLQSHPATVRQVLTVTYHFSRYTNKPSLIFQP